MDIDRDPRWPQYEKLSEELSEARANFKTAEHNYMLALRKLRQVEVESNAVWHALVETGSQLRQGEPR